jgi:ketosteroid isomerase-like protein
MHANEALITRFYEAFARHDGPAMAACYHPDATFSDPAFPDLKGKQPGAMWSMLTERGGDLVIRFSNVRADDTSGSAHWEADYTFSATGRPVKNVIEATFTFRDGLIHTHVDRFDFWTWSRQALGMSGLFLGWSGFLQRKVQAMAGKQLSSWSAKHGLT